jgi:hypothetical protein
MRDHWIRAANMPWRALAITGLASLAVLPVTGCRATTQNVATYADQLPKPQLIVVHDFTSNPGEVRLQSGLIGRVTEEMRAAQGTPVAAQEAKLQDEVTRAMTAQLVQEIAKLGLPVTSAESAGPVAGPVVTVEGQFLTIDEGNRARRLLIGLGAGASHVRTAVQVFQTNGGQQRLVEDFYTNANSSRKPGLAVMGGAGAAVGAATAVTAGVGAGTTVIAGKQDAESDAKEAAVAVTKELAKFFAKQGWITAEQADKYVNRLIP